MRPSPEDDDGASEITNKFFFSAIADILWQAVVPVNRKKVLYNRKFLLYDLANMGTLKITKFSVGLTKEDMAVLQRAKRFLRIKHGEVSNIVAIRTALREYVAAQEREQEQK
jgi:hypothetical protein